MHGKGCVEGRVSLVILSIGKPCVWASLSLVSWCVCIEIKPQVPYLTLCNKVEFLQEIITGVKWRTIN